MKIWITPSKICPKLFYTLTVIVSSKKILTAYWSSTTFTNLSYHKLPKMSLNLLLSTQLDVGLHNQTQKYSLKLLKYDKIISVTLFYSNICRSFIDFVLCYSVHILSVFLQNEKFKPYFIFHIDKKNHTLRTTRELKQHSADALINFSINLVTQQAG